MNADYAAGRKARTRNHPVTACPHSRQSSEFGSPAELRESSPLCRRHWWLAGWGDRDMELGHRISEVAA